MISSFHQSITPLISDRFLDPFISPVFSILPSHCYPHISSSLQPFISPFLHPLVCVSPFLHFVSSPLHLFLSTHSLFYSISPPLLSSLRSLRLLITLALFILSISPFLYIISSLFHQSIPLYLSLYYFINLSISSSIHSGLF